MKTASFYCPYDSVFKVIQTVVERKGYSITSANSHESLIRARSKKKLLKKPKTLDFKVYKIDQFSTGMKLMVNDKIAVN